MPRIVNEVEMDMDVVEAIEAMDFNLEPVLEDYDTVEPLRVDPEYLNVLGVK